MHGANAWWVLEISREDVLGETTGKIKAPHTSFMSEKG